MNFFNIIRKGTNKDLNALKSSAIYEIAKEKLAPKTYAELAKPLYLLSSYFSNVYHFISFVVAIIGITIFALQLDSILQKTILIILSFLLLAIVEVAKSNASNTVFSSIARKENPNKLFLIVLVLTTLFSFVTSTWSAKESIYFASTNSKFSNIDSLQNSQIDSINSLFSTQISSIESSLKASQNTLETSKNKWLRIATTKDLQTSQNSLNNILEKKEKALLSITSNTQNSKDSTDDKGKEIAIFAAVLFALFELLNLVCYWFVYQYFQSCLLENNLPNLPNEQQDKVPGTGKTHDVTDAIISNPFTPTLQPTMERKIGFEYGNTSNRNECYKEPIQAVNEQKTDLGKGNKICKNCNEAYTYKIHNQKYCSSDCRIDFWQKAKNKKLHFKSNT